MHGRMKVLISICNVLEVILELIAFSATAKSRYPEDAQYEIINLGSWRPVASSAVNLDEFASSQRLSLCLICVGRIE